MKAKATFAVVLTAVTIGNGFVCNPRRWYAKPRAVWSSDDERQLVGRLYTAKLNWNERLMELHEYKEKFGDCLVPHRYEPNPALGNWVNKQRQLYSKFQKGEPSSMTDDRVVQLTNLGFVWDAKRVKVAKNSNRDKSWWDQYEKMKAFMLQHGNNSLPTANSSLGNWIHAQRKAYEVGQASKQRGLTTERINALESIGFLWKTHREQTWDRRIRELQTYKDEHGDCIVPISYEHRKLANWVSNQRKHYNLRIAGKPSTLTDARIAQLEGMGFVWNRWEYEFLQKNINVVEVCSIR